MTDRRESPQSLDWGLRAAGAGDWGLMTGDLKKEERKLVQVSFAHFNEPKKKKCECCDRLSLVEVKMFVSKDCRLVGDLDLCANCGQLLMEVTAKSKVEKEWTFGGGESLG